MRSDSIGNQWENYGAIQLSGQEMRESVFLNKKNVNCR